MSINEVVLFFIYISVFTIKIFENKKCIQTFPFNRNAIKRIITPYIRMLNSDWLIAVIFFYNIFKNLYCENGDIYKK
jgi:glycopeptide antibiotics resistance protein